MYTASLCSIYNDPATSLGSGTQMRTRYAILLTRRNETDHENNGRFDEFGYRIRFFKENDNG